MTPTELKVKVGASSDTDNDTPHDTSSYRSDSDISFGEESDLLLADWTFYNRVLTDHEQTKLIEEYYNIRFGL